MILSKFEAPNDHILSLNVFTILSSNVAIQLI